MKSKKGFQTMEDEKIVELYLLRNEEALGASKVKYGRMLLGLSQALLWNREDSEECENDTYLTAWNRIPPDRPSFLGAYLSKIVRYLSLNLLRKRNAGKRPETSLVPRHFAGREPGGVPAAVFLCGAGAEDRLRAGLYPRKGENPVVPGEGTAESSS